MDSVCECKQMKAWELFNPIKARLTRLTIGPTMVPSNQYRSIDNHKTWEGKCNYASFAMQPFD